MVSANEDPSGGTSLVTGTSGERRYCDSKTLMGMS